MNLNIVSYIAYALVTFFIILRVGWLFYHHGAAYLYEIYGRENGIANSLNKILLLGYYLINLGYTIVCLGSWPKIESNIQMVETLSSRIGIICLILGLMHFFNMAWVQLLREKILNQNN